MKIKKHGNLKKNSLSPGVAAQSPGTHNKNTGYAIIPRASVMAVLLAIWAFVVLKNLAPNMQWRLSGGLFDGGDGFSFIRFAGVFFASHLVNVFYAIVIFLAAFFVGIVCLKRFSFASGGGALPLDEKNFSEGIYLNVALGLGIIAVSVFILGSVGIMGFAGGIILKTVIYILAIGGILGARNLYLERYFPPDGSCAAKKSEPFSFYEKIIALLIFSAAFVNLLGALTPETFYDSQYYQLGVPARWLSEGKITPDNYIPASFMPFNVNMLYMLAMFLSGGNPIPAKIVHYLCGILILFAVYSVGKKYFSRFAGLIAAAVFYTVPLVMMVSWKTAVELGIGIFEFAAMVCLLKSVDIPPEEGISPPAAFLKDKKTLWLALAGIFVGFSVGSKYTSIVFCYLSLALAVLFSGGFGKAFPGKLRALLIFSCMVFIVASPWYIRNMIVTSNPIHPFFWEKFSRLPLRPGNNLFADPTPPKFSVVNYLGFLWPLTMGNLQQESYPGAVFLLFIPLFFVIRKTDAKIKFSILYLLFSVVLWAKFGRFYLRYFIPALPVAALTYGYYLAHPVYIKNGFYRFLIVAALVWPAFVNINFSSGILSATQDPWGYVSGNLGEKDYLSTQRPSYPAPCYGAVDWMNLNLPSDAKVLYLGETRALYLKRKFRISGAGEWWWFQEKLKEARSGEEFYKMIKEDGITHILFNAPEARRLSGYEPFYFDPEMLKIFDEFWRSHVREVYKDISDIYLPQYGIRSMKREQPQWWEGYARDPLNYVYVYEVLSSEEAAGSSPSENFLLRKDFYPEKRWLVIKDSAAALLKK